MEEETRSVRRSSRSRSTTPSLSVAPAEGERLQGMKEATYRIERFQAIREVVIEGQNEVSMSSSVSQTYSRNGDVGMNNNLSLEAQQNAINVSQEKKKKKTSKTAEDKPRRATKTPAKKSTTNGSAAKKKSVSNQSEASQDEIVASSSTTKSRASSRNVPSLDAYRSTKSSPKASPQARKLYEEALNGQIDTENSVFLKFYRNIGEWWNYYKKTDYTYSPLSDQRYEIAPGFFNMPNLSRRPLGSYLSSVSKMQRNFSYNLAREDSDSEEYVDPRRYYKEETSQQFSIWQRVSLAVKTFFIFIYTYTFGALIGGVSYLANRIKAAFSAVRNTNERETKTYYYYKETVVSDNFAAEEAITWKQKIATLFLMIWGGLSRNWGKLLCLLLLLLLAYAVYTGDFNNVKGDVAERLTKFQGDFSENFFDITEGVKKSSLAYYQIALDRYDEIDLKNVLTWPSWLELADNEQGSVVDTEVVEPAVENIVSVEEPVVA